MNQSIIDLRKKDSRASPKQSQALVPVKEKSNLPVPVEEESAPLLKWVAREYEHRHRGPYWFLAPGVFALGLVVIGIFAHSYFFVAFVALAYGVLMVYTHRTPENVKFSIAEEGIQMGGKLRPFSDFKSFFVFEANDRREISLETKNFVMPFLSVPLGATDGEIVRDILLRFLPEEEHEETFSDKFARGLGL